MTEGVCLKRKRILLLKLREHEILEKLGDSGYGMINMVNWVDVGDITQRI